MEWEMICRVCLQGGDMVSLFDCDENNELLSDKYMYCSAIEVLESEPLPSNICLTCVDRLMSAYQFKQQCVSSTETLKECLLEFQKSNGDTTTPKKGTEVITIKQENGVYLQYEIPIEEDGGARWPSQRTGEPVKRKRGRPRKYPDASGMIPISPYTRKDKDNNDDSLLIKLKEEPVDGSKFEQRTDNDPLDDGELADYNTDPDYVPGAEDAANADEASDKDSSIIRLLKASKSKSHGRRGRPRKMVVVKSEQDSDREDEDVLLKETIMANSEPIPDFILNPEVNQKKYPKKKYYYDKIHTCEQCGASFRSNASLQAHIRRHLGIKPFSCSICGYSCVLNMELRRHMMRHTGVKPYKCRICDRYFGDFGSRQKHERLHLGERPYQCSLCGKNFTYSYVLSNHMLTHTGVKKYECQPCSKKFTKAHHLKYHNKVHHKELYQQELLLQQSKKEQMQIQNVNITELTSVCTEELLGLQGGQIVEDNIQIHQDDESMEHVESENVTEDYVDHKPEIQEYTENEEEMNQEYEENENDQAGEEYGADNENQADFVENENQEENMNVSQEYASNDDASQEYVEDKHMTQDGDVEDSKDVQIINDFPEDDEAEVKTTIWKKRLPF